MQPSHSEVEERINQIEAEMRRIGMWQEEPLRPEQLNFERSFGGDTMAFRQWLQFVFIPRVRQIIAERGQFPAQSYVGTQAYREWKMWGDEKNVDDLLLLLHAFDEMFGKQQDA